MSVPESHNLKGMNVLLFMIDQQRAIQHFPKNWAEENLHGLTRLKANGLTFPRAFCNACMCSPSRATLMTGYFPAQHGVKWTLETNMPSPEYPQAQLPLDLPNIATVMASVGYSTPYKGKFHLSKPLPHTDWKPEDVNKYGFQRWNPPDGGANQDTIEFGGGQADNDGRFMYFNGPTAENKEGVLAYLNSVAAAQQPFFMVVSLVNPHDVLAYPNTAMTNGYTPRWLEGNIGLPETIDEDLSTKPSVQQQLLDLLNATNGLGPLEGPQRRNYLNFYGNLMKSSDHYLVEILDTLRDRGLLEKTLVVYTSDHGEMGLAHGGLRQKNFNFYEETLRVPLVYSNPVLFRNPVESEAMVSHVDFLPTLANLFGAPPSARADWQGVDYSQIVMDPQAPATQKYVVFTYDDYQSGQPKGPYPGPLNHIVSIREERYKLAEYYSLDHPDLAPQWEMYDLLENPEETRNLAWSGHHMTDHQKQEYERLRADLEAVKRTRLQPLAEAAQAGGTR